MGNSTRTLLDVIDQIAPIGDISPLAMPSGYGPSMALKIGNKTMRTMIARRFNWKWNSVLATPFLTNSWQQDYPQIGLSNVGWLESCFWVDINNTVLPKPHDQIYVNRDLPVVAQVFSTTPATHINWDYNQKFQFGAWPGAGSVYAPLLNATISPQNGPMAIKDVNGNILTLTTFGTTGNTAPSLAAGSQEGATVTDGSCVWTCCNPLGQGWRLWPLPPSSGPVYQINPIYQLRAPTFTDLAQMLDPIPDDYSQWFEVGYKAYAMEYSTDPQKRNESDRELLKWQVAMDDACKQGDKEVSGYGLIPAARPVASVYGDGTRRNPMDPLRPY
jgi:hypothetical protein